MIDIKFKRILVKISGESLMGNFSFGIDPSTLTYIAEELESVVNAGVQLSIVIGGGNIFRGIRGKKLGVDRHSSDYMGMLATVFNGVALHSILERKGIDSRIQSAIRISGIAESYIRNVAIKHLNKGRIVIFVAGLGNPYFTTDTAAVLRAVETKSDILIKATTVPGLYDSDPKVNFKARFIDSIDYMGIITKQLKIMDLTAISLAMDNNLPLILFDVRKKGNLKKILLGKKVGTIVKKK